MKKINISNTRLCYVIYFLTLIIGLIFINIICTNPVNAQIRTSTIYVDKGEIVNDSIPQKFYKISNNVLVASGFLFDIEKIINGNSHKTLSIKITNLTYLDKPLEIVKQAFDSDLNAIVETKEMGIIYGKYDKSVRLNYQFFISAESEIKGLFKPKKEGSFQSHYYQSLDSVLLKSFDEALSTIPDGEKSLIFSDRSKDSYYTKPCHTYSGSSSSIKKIIQKEFNNEMDSRNIIEGPQWLINVDLSENVIQIINITHPFNFFTIKVWHIGKMCYCRIGNSCCYNLMVTPLN